MDRAAELDGAFAQAAEARRAIATIVEAVRSGEMDLEGAFVQADTDQLMGRTFAVKVIEVVPGIGKVRARRAMEAVGMDDDVWMANVTPAHRAAIIAELSDPDPQPPAL